MEALHRRMAGIDVHRMLHVVTVLIEQPDGTVTQEMRRFGGFKKDMRAMTAWLVENQVERVVMESTGIYWKSAYAHLEAAGIAAWVVNAQHIKQVPGRKTDVSDSAWLAQLGRFGLVKGSFIPDANLRELRLVSHYRKKLTGMLAAEKNRLHKLLDDAGIKLGEVASDINGVSARADGRRLDQGRGADRSGAVGTRAVEEERSIADRCDGRRVAGTPPVGAGSGVAPYPVSGGGNRRPRPRADRGNAAVCLGMATVADAARAG